MSIKAQLIILAATALLAFAYGRYSVDIPPKETTNVNETTTTEKQTVTVVIERPDGTRETTTRIDETAKREVDVTRVLEPSNAGGRGFSAYSVALLASVNVNSVQSPDFGVSVSKQFIGPTRLGLFGMKSGVIGVSLGVDF